MSKKQKQYEHFLDGRNGMDVFNWILMVLIIIFLILGTFITNIIADLVLIGIACALLIWYIFRVMSRNLVKRQKENQVPVRAGQAIARWFKLQKLRWTDRKHHVYKKCPSCKKVLRFKRRKGRKQVTCPYCGTTFTVIIHRKGDEDRSTGAAK